MLLFCYFPDQETVLKREAPYNLLPAKKETEVDNKELTAVKAALEKHLSETCEAIEVKVCPLENGLHISATVSLRTCGDHVLLQSLYKFVWALVPDWTGSAEDYFRTENRELGKAHASLGVSEPVARCAVDKLLEGT